MPRRPRAAPQRPPTLPPIPPPHDIALVSLGTTFGWRHADDSLVAMLEQAGYSCELRRVRIGAAGKLRRTMAGTDLVEALAARRAAAGASAGAIIYSSVTAALLQHPRVPYAVRFDTVATLNRPGITGAWQRAREPRVLARARLLLPWSEAAARAAEELVRRFDAPPRIIVLPVPIERFDQPSAPPDIDAVAYCANPPKRGLDLLCEAWRSIAPRNARLIVGGVDQSKADRFLNSAGVVQPPGVEWAGDLPRERWLEHVRRARVFVNASRYEDWGIAPLEALASGTPLVTVPSAGPFEALHVARELNPTLVADQIAAAPLAEAISAGLRLSETERVRYARAAADKLERYRPEAIQRVVAQEVAPLLSRSVS